MAVEYPERLTDKWGTKLIEGKIVGRDKQVVPPEEVVRLAELGCNDREIAEWFGIAESTLRYNFSAELDKGASALKQRLRFAMLRNACEKDNAAVQIFLAKNILSMSDNGMNTASTQVLPWSDDDDTKDNFEVTQEHRNAMQQEYDQSVHTAVQGQTVD